MLKFGNVFSNLLVVGILAGFGYIIYLKLKGEKPELFKNLLSKGKDLKEKADFAKGRDKMW